MASAKICGVSCESCVDCTSFHAPLSPAAWPPWRTPARESPSRPPIDSQAFSRWNHRADRLGQSLGGFSDGSGEQTFDSPRRGLSHILFRGCNASGFVALLLLERGAVILVMRNAGVRAQCALAAHDAKRPQLGHIRASARSARRRRTATLFRFVIQSAECAAACDHDSEEPTTHACCIVRKAMRGNEKRLSLESGRCTFAHSRVTQLSEVAGQKIRLAHLVTTDSAA